jgi:hypothetical protein
MRSYVHHSCAPGDATTADYRDEPARERPRSIMASRRRAASPLLILGRTAPSLSPRRRGQTRAAGRRHRSKQRSRERRMLGSAEDTWCFRMPKPQAHRPAPGLNAAPSFEPGTVLCI